MPIGLSNLHHYQDQLFPDSLTGSARYVDPGHSTTEVKFLDGTTRPSIQGDRLENRDDMLHEIAKRRLDDNRKLWKKGVITTAERYSGFEDGLKNKIIGIAKRALSIIKEWSFDQGLIKYDLKLLKNPKTLAWVNYSVKQVRDFVVKPDIRDMKAQDVPKTWSISRWHHNGEKAYTFINEKGKNETLQNTVTASNDRNAKGISMMRHVDDYTTDESIAYTGRADTESKAMEQLQFIFANELGKKAEAQKGLTKTDAGYDLTFMVNNLMSANKFLGMGLTGLAGLDERKAITREKAIFDALAGKTITLTDKYGRPHQVSIKPLYFAQGFNSLGSLFGTPGKEKSINKEGYKVLLPLIRNGIDAQPEDKDKQLLSAALLHLSSPDKLKPEEEFFYRDLAMKILKIPVVDHCKSSIDRTSLAIAISAATQSWRNLEKAFPDAPHKILSDPLFKDLFMANIQGCHQATRVSRSAEGVIKGQKQLSRALGFEWGGNGLNQNPIALRLVPDRYKDESKKNFNLNSPLMAGRVLLKPKGMKMYYKNDDLLIVKQEEDLKRIAQERLAWIRSMYTHRPDSTG